MGCRIGERSAREWEGGVQGHAQIPRARVEKRNVVCPVFPGTLWSGGEALRRWTRLAVGDAGECI